MRSRDRCELAVDGATPARLASSEAGRARPSMSDKSMATRDGSLTSSPKLAMSKRAAGIVECIPPSFYGGARKKPFDAGRSVSAQLAWN